MGGILMWMEQGPINTNRRYPAIQDVAAPPGDQRATACRALSVQGNFTFDGDCISLEATLLSSICKSSHGAINQAHGYAGCRGGPRRKGAGTKFANGETEPQRRALAQTNGRTRFTWYFHLRTFLHKVQINIRCASCR